MQDIIFFLFTVDIIRWLLAYEQLYDKQLTRDGIWPLRPTSGSSIFNIFEVRSNYATHKVQVQWGPVHTLLLCVPGIYVYTGIPGTVVCCCIPCPPGRRSAFVGFIVSLSFIELSKLFDTILSYRYRTIISKLSIRYPTLTCMHAEVLCFSRWKLSPRW